MVLKAATTELSPDELLRENIIAALRTCYDPEIPVNVYDLGLIYGIHIDPEKNVRIDMTLTSPNCPSIKSLPEEIRDKVSAIPGVKSATVELVWDPPFSVAMMSDEAKLQLGLL
ncbi:MAG: DUF59 domain-containing protein [Turneriella sp.]|nr:DUF59 domain-containing protein [Turneriella sp.]